MSDVWENAFFFFEAPKDYDFEAVRPKWNDAKKGFFTEFLSRASALSTWDTASIEACFKALAEELGIKVGEVQMPMRIMLCGGKFGPPVFEIAATIGQKESIERIAKANSLF